MTNQGDEIEIIEYFSAKNCTIKFSDGLIKKNVIYNHIKRGNIKNPYRKTISDVGYLGEGNYSANINGVTTNCYHVWRNMIHRCYSEKYQQKQPTYIGCSVDERWHNFQVFAKWYYENYVEEFELDKDILIEGNKIYSPETCCFVPHEINGLFIKRKIKKDGTPCGVHKHGSKFYVKINIEGQYKVIDFYTTPEEALNCYSFHKEKHIKEVAEKWKNQITKDVYNCLYNYKFSAFIREISGKKIEKEEFEQQKQEVIKRIIDVSK